MRQPPDIGSEPEALALRRAAHKARSDTQVDMNLVSLIDVFTILIFFLLSNASEVELLPASKAVRLPESVAETQPEATLVVTVSAEDILVEGRRVAATPEALARRLATQDFSPDAAAVTAFWLASTIPG